MGKYIKTYEELSPVLYKRVAKKLKDFGFEKRSDRMTKHLNKHRDVVKLHKSGYENLEPFEIVLTKYISYEKTGLFKVKFMGWQVDLDWMETEVGIYDDDPRWVEAENYSSDDDTKWIMEEHIPSLSITPIFHFVEKNDFKNIGNDMGYEYLTLFPHLVVPNMNATSEYSQDSDNPYIGYSIDEGYFKKSELDGSENYIKFSNRKDAVRFKKLMSIDSDLFGSKYTEAIKNLIEKVGRTGGEQQPDEIRANTNVADISKVIKNMNINLMYDEDYSDIQHDAGDDLLTRAGRLRLHRMQLKDKVPLLGDYFINKYSYYKLEDMKKLLYTNRNILNHVLDNIGSRGVYKSKSYSQTHSSVVRARKFVQDFIDSMDEYNDIDSNADDPNI